MRKLTLERLKEVLSYDLETGIFRWKTISKFSNRTVGQVAGCPNLGYVKIKIDRIEYLAHQLAWFWITEDFPDHHIDHINGIRNDNRGSNLRESDYYLNAENKRAAQKNSAVGLLGVRRIKNRFNARITVDYKIKCLGTYDTAEEAHQVYLTAKRELHLGCTI